MISASNIRILIIDDHPLVRAATKMLLHSCKQFDVVGEAADGATGVNLALKYCPDVVLTDINMTPIDGIETTRRLLQADPSLIVIGFSALPHRHQENEMLQAGAVSVINKSAGRQELCDGILEQVKRRSAQRRW